MSGTALLLAMALGATQVESMRYLALGDSYTIGESVAAEQRWPVQLSAGLRELGLAVADPDIVARTGWTTDELDRAIDAAVEAGEVSGEYQLVSLLIGVNNQYRGRSVESHLPEFEALLQRAIGYAGGKPQRVIVLSIPDWGVTPFAAAQKRDAAEVARSIDAYNAAQRAVCARLGVAWIDITPGTREASARPELLAADGLHPSGIDYARWAAKALPVARQALQSGDR